MLDRCYNKNNKRYKDWGGRGVTVCNRWRFGENGKTGFECFLEDMGLKPHPKLTIERRDNNKGYSTENCYWGTRKEQANNRRNNTVITSNEKTLTLAQWERELGLQAKSLSGRFRTMRHLDTRIRRTNIADTASRLKMIEVLARRAGLLICDLEMARK